MGVYTIKGKQCCKFDKLDIGGSYSNYTGIYGYDFNNNSIKDGYLFFDFFRCT